jgi:hypothetical protein
MSDIEDTARGAPALIRYLDEGAFVTRRYVSQGAEMNTGNYRDYPVVGVNWLQANDFCAWRTDRVNEAILIREGLFEDYPSQINEDHFTTDAYLAAQYESGK